MSFTQDLFTQRRNFEDGNTRIGQLDRIWYDEHRNAFYIGDGVTPGGKLIGAGGNVDVDIINANTIVTTGNITAGNINVTGTINGDHIFAPNGFGYYGSFWDTTTQTAAITSTAYAMRLGNTDQTATYGISVTGNSNVIISSTGIYNFQFSIQLTKASGGSAFIYIWPRINGDDVPMSASKVAIQGTAAETVPAWNWVYRMNANDRFQIMWSTTDTGVQILSTAPNNPAPGIPSVILTVTQV